MDRRYFSPEIETMRRDEIDRVREERLLGDLLPWAYQRSALIRETWDAAGVTADDIQSMDDFHAKVPFIDKDAIRAFRDHHRDPYGGMLCLDPKMTEVFSAIFSTSGTTGDPTPAPYAGRGPSMLVREFWELGCRPGDYFTYCLFTFRGPGIHDTIRGIGATPVFVDHQPADVPQLVRFSRELRPTAGTTCPVRWWSRSNNTRRAPRSISQRRSRVTAASRSRASRSGRVHADCSRTGGAWSCSCTRASGTSAPPPSAASTTATTSGRTRATSSHSIPMASNRSAT